jgi:hypothetical protein
MLNHSSAQDQISLSDARCLNGSPSGRRSSSLCDGSAVVRGNPATRAGKGRSSSYCITSGNSALAGSESGGAGGRSIAQRFKANLAKLISGDIYQVAEVVRDLSLRDRRKALSAGETRMLAKALRS